MDSIVIRRTNASDLNQLGIIGPAAYAETYSYLWDRPDAYVRQLTSFGAEAFAELLAKPNICLWTAAVNDRVVGFLSLRLGSPDPIGHRPGGAEIARLYLLAPARKLRLGSGLLQMAIKQARDNGSAYLWLDVMVSAREARDAYARWGFEQIGTRHYGGGLREDLSEMMVMMKRLS